MKQFSYILVFLLLQSTTFYHRAVSGAEQQVEEGSGENIPIEKRETNVKKIRERLMMARIESPVGEIFSVEAPKIRLFERSKPTIALLEMRGEQLQSSDEGFDGSQDDLQKEGDFVVEKMETALSTDQAEKPVNSPHLCTVYPDCDLRVEIERGKCIRQTSTASPSVAQRFGYLVEMLNDTFSQNPPDEITPAMIESCIQSVMKNVVDTLQYEPEDVELDRKRTDKLDWCLMHSASTCDIKTSTEILRGIWQSLTDIDEASANNATVDFEQCKKNIDTLQANCMLLRRCCLFVRIDCARTCKTFHRCESSFDKQSEFVSRPFSKTRIAVDHGVLKRQVSNCLTHELQAVKIRSVFG